MTTTQTETEMQTNQSNDEDKTKKETKASNRTKRHKVHFFPAKNSKSMVWKPKSVVQHRTILGLAEGDPDLEVPNSITDKNGNERSSAKRPEKAIVLAKKIDKIAHYQNLSMNQSKSAVAISPLRDALLQMYEAVAKERTKQVEHGQENEEAQPQEEHDEPLPRISEVSVYLLRHALNSFIISLLAPANVAIQSQGKVVFKVRYLYNSVLNFSLQNSVPKLSDNIMLAMQNIGDTSKPEDKINYKEYTMEIDGLKIPVPNLYRCTSLTTLLIKSGITSQSPSVKHALNKIAAIYLYMFARDSFFSLKELQKKTLDIKMTKLVLTHSFKTKIYG